MFKQAKFKKDESEAFRMVCVNIMTWIRTRPRGVYAFSERLVKVEIIGRQKIYKKAVGIPVNVRASKRISFRYTSRAILLAVQAGQ